MRKTKLQSNTNVMLVANYPPDVGYAWWLMENFWILIADVCSDKGLKCYLAYPTAGRAPETISKSSIEPLVCDWNDHSPIGLWNRSIQRSGSIPIMSRR